MVFCSWKSDLPNFPSTFPSEEREMHEQQKTLEFLGVTKGIEEHAIAQIDGGGVETFFHTVENLTLR